MAKRWSPRRQHSRRSPLGKMHVVRATWVSTSGASKKSGTAYRHTCRQCGAEVVSVRMKGGGWAHFEGAKGLSRIKHPCFHRGEGLSKRRDKDTPDLFDEDEKAKNKKAIPSKPTDWRPATLARMRKLIEEADPDAVEEMKWKKPSNPKGVPTWSHDGIICTGQIFKGKVKITFAKGALLKDPSRLFNASLDGNMMRAIDIGEGSTIDEAAFKALFRKAADLNIATRKAKTR